MVHRHRSRVLVVCLAAQSVALTAAGSTAAHWSESIGRGDECRRLGKYTEARRSYLDALAEAEKFGPDDQRLGSTLNNLAALLFDYGNDGEAEALYRRALPIFERAGAGGRDNLAHVLNNLAVIAARHSRLEEARTLYERSLALADREGSDGPQTAAILNNIGDLARRQGRDQEAESLYRRSIAAWRKHEAEQGRAALVQGNLATLYYSQGRFDEAQELLEECLRTQQALLGPEHPRLANNMTHLGEIYALRHRYAEAEDLFRRALDLQGEIARAGSSGSAHEPERAGQAADDYESKR